MGTYSFFGKVTSWLGTLVFTVANETTGSMRLSVLILILFFAIPFIIVFTLPNQESPASRARREAAERATRAIAVKGASTGQGQYYEMDEIVSPKGGAVAEQQQQQQQQHLDEERPNMLVVFHHQP